MSHVISHYLSSCHVISHYLSHITLLITHPPATLAGERQRGVVKGVVKYCSVAFWATRVDLKTCIQHHIREKLDFEATWLVAAQRGALEAGTTGSQSDWHHDPRPLCCCQDHQ
jgi:hypothetical protein